MRIAYATLAALALSASPAHALPRCLDGPGGACVLWNDQGGTSLAYEPFIATLKASGRAVVIRGDCTSYCSILADRLRAQTCLDPGAGFHLHKLVPQGARRWSVGVIEGAHDPAFSAPLASWIAAHGGLPEARADYDTLYMSHAEALKLWKECKP